MDSTVEQEWIEILKAMEQTTHNNFWVGSPWRNKILDLLEKYGFHDTHNN